MIGPIAAEIKKTTMFLASIGATAKRPQAAGALIAFLAASHGRRQ